jgi:serine/threonine protein kinase
VISPTGRAIYRYEKKPELLRELRDAIKAHRSLYFKGDILHWDISENNIIITDPKETGVIGMLIDLDLAKELGSGRSDARCCTGTMEFMAIEVLLGSLTPIAMIWNRSSMFLSGNVLVAAGNF